MEIDPIHFDLKVILGRATISLPFSSFCLGDILILDQLIEKPLPLEIDGKIFGHGTPGIYESHKAVKIVKP